MDISKLINSNEECGIRRMREQNGNVERRMRRVSDSRLELENKQLREKLNASISLVKALQVKINDSADVVNDEYELYKNTFSESKNEDILATMSKLYENIDNINELKLNFDDGIVKINEETKEMNFLEFVNLVKCAFSLIDGATIDVEIKSKESEVEELISGSPLFNDLQGNNDDMKVNDSKDVERELPIDRDAFNAKIAEMKLGDSVWENIVGTPSKFKISKVADAEGFDNPTIFDYNGYKILYE